jgi:hypothetical protein
MALAEAYTKRYGPLVESYNDAKNTPLGWTDDGNGVWVLPGSRANLDRFDDVRRSHPSLGTM